MSDSSNSATRQVLALGGRGVHWARGCVAALVDDLAAVEQAASDWKALALVEGSGTGLYARRKGQLLNLGQCPPGAAALAAAVDGALSKAEREAFALRFASGRAIVHTLALPASARPVVAAIIRNKIEALAPWPLEDTAWGYVLGAETGGSLPVTVGAVGRKALASYLEALAALGVKPQEVDIAADVGGAGAVVIDHSGEARRKRARLMLNLAAGGLAAAIAAAGVIGAYGAFSTYMELNRVAARTEELKRDLSGKPGAGEAAGMLAEASRLVERKKAERPLVAVLNDLTRAVPDGSWLTALDVADGQVTLQGRGGPAPEVVQSVEKAEAFSGANFAAATQHDEQAGTDVFAITAAIEPAEVQQ